MQLILYKNSAEANRVDKTQFLEVVATMEGTLRAECNVSSPSIEVALDKPLNCNYAYIDEFSRYYFITSVDSVRTGYWRINMSVDVLMSFKNEIKELNVLVGRNENSYNTRLENKTMYFKYDKNIYEYKPTMTEDVVSFNSDERPRYYLLTFFTTHSSIYGVYPDSNIPHASNLFPSVNTSRAGITSSTYTALIHTKRENGSQYPDESVTALATYVGKHQNISSFIVNCISIPFPLEKRADSVGSSLYLGDTLISEGIVSSETSAPLIFIPDSPIGKRYLVASFDITKENTYRSYEPYTEYELYLPYKGWIKLSAEQVVNKHIYVYYSVEYSTGMGLIQICTNDNMIVYEDTCQLGVQIPFSTSDYQERNNTIFSSAISTAVHSVASATTRGALYSLGNSKLLNPNTYLERGKAYAPNGMLNVYNYNHIRMRETTMIPTVDETSSAYKKIYGLPLCEFKTLNEVTGFTQCNDYHLENFTTATINEINEIDTLLKGGILL